MKSFKWIPLLFLTGCAVGPDYQTPQVTLPSHYDATETTGELDAGELQHWWTAFNDPLLDVLIHEALSQNFDLRIAVEKIHEVRALYQIQAAELWPKVDLNAEVIRERVSQSLFDSPFLGPPVQSLYRVGFDASWEVDIFGKRRREKEAAYYEYEAEVENARGVYITLLSEVAANYIEMRAFQQKISLSE
ncbi:MAG: TolC family protein, partial [Bdellovibrionales bacterium]|nr:TolC family protein [Bdellovibrionales bacterium]